MTEGADTQGTPAQTPERDRRPLTPRVRATLVLGVVLALAGLTVWGLSWWTHGRFIESTNNAYLAADAAIVAPRIAGHVTKVLVRADQSVKRGEPLLRIDARPYEAALAEAQASVMAREADLARTRAEIERQRASVEEATARIDVEASALALAKTEVRRATALASRGADTEQRRDEAIGARRQQVARVAASSAAANAARRQIDLLQAQLRQNEAALAGARAALERARVDLDATVVRAAQAGRIGDRAVVAGQYVQPGTRLMSIVPTTELYLVANFKETQIRRMRIGQAVEVEIDALPNAPVRGRLLSLAPGTGAQFALLPPENATGNFNKIVQRVPVRVALDLPAEIRGLAVPGLSAEVRVDTR